MITDPRFAPARSDLPFLRRRVRPKQQAAPAAPAKPAAAAPSPAATPHVDGPKIDYSRHDRPGTPAAAAAPPVTPPPVTPPPTVTPADAAPVDYTHHGSAGGSLDLDAPSPAAAPTPAPARTSPGTPAPPAAPRRPAPAPPAQLPAWQQRHVVRVEGRSQHIMSVADPTVTLSRVQSGIGQLLIEAVCSADVGDLRLGAAYQLRSGGTGIVAHADGNRFGPSSRRPVVVGSREEYERIGIDLRQTTDIERIAIFAYSESRAELTWGGTLVVHLLRGARLEIPLERLYPGRIAMLVTLYNMDGELVVRAELETIAGDVREAARAYGFDRITWRDDRNPVD